MKCLTNLKNLNFLKIFREFSFYKRNSQLFSIEMFNKKEKFIEKFNFNEIHGKHSFLKNEFKLNINKQTEIDHLVYLLNNEIKLRSIHIKLEKISYSKFFENLDELSGLLETISYNNFVIYYKNNKDLFETIKNMILSDKFKLEDIMKAKGVLSFLYLLDKKKHFNLTREMNDNIMNKILHQIERNFMHIEINMALECAVMLAYFGISLDVTLLERKIKNENSNLNFNKINNVKFFKFKFNF